MKVFLANLNVGSAIEYVGDVVKKWIQEHPVDLVDYKDQTSETITFARLLTEQPDVIVVNEIYPRIISPVLFYKLAFPDTRIILLIHSQKYLLDQETEDANIKNQHTMLMDLVSRADRVYTLDGKKTKAVEKEIPMFCPSEPELFHNEIPWNKRTNLFCIMGNIYPLKICMEFLEKARNIPTVFDVYGDIAERFSTLSYRQLFQEATTFNLKYLGKLQQDKVGKFLNHYKFIVFPHNGPESFGMMLQQAIMCGTIPIVLNDDSGRAFNPHWIDWASNLYYGSNTIENLLENIKRLTTDTEDLTPVSKFISTEVMKRFNYYNFKREFQSFFSSNPAQ